MGDFCARLCGTFCRPTERLAVSTVSTTRLRRDATKLVGNGRTRQRVPPSAVRSFRAPSQTTTASRWCEPVMEESLWPNTPQQKALSGASAERSGSKVLQRSVNRPFADSRLLKITFLAQTSTGKNAFGFIRMYSYFALSPNAASPLVNCRQGKTT